MVLHSVPAQVMSNADLELCRRCADAGALGFDFTHAFQPIVDIASGEVFANEALVRPLDADGGGNSAAPVLKRVDARNRYRFDQASRVKAIQLAAALGMETRLSINFLPNAVYEPENCIQATLAAAHTCRFPLERLIFEVTEVEKVSDKAHLQAIITEYKRQGFLTAIDDFGAGYAGLNLLADFEPDLLKLDRELITEIDRDSRRRAIVKSIVGVCRDLGIEPIAEGVESRDEMLGLADQGITLFQGYYFARPEREALPAVAADRLGA